MTVSELITELESLRTEFGDLPVTVFDPDEFADGNLSPTMAFICINEDQDGTAVSVSLVDRNTAEALYE